MLPNYVLINIQTLNIQTVITDKYSQFLFD